jgi:hypothetical protein
VASKLLVVSAADTAFFHLLKDMLCSLEHHAAVAQSDAPQLEIGILDLGLSPDNLDWLRSRTDRFAKPRPHFGGHADRPIQLGYLARPFLPEYFPGFDVYLWIDSDIWLQSPDAVQAMVAGAERKGMGIATESERAYHFQRWLFLWTAKHFALGYGPVRGAWLLTKPHLNAGMFAIHRDAPHWSAWIRRYRSAFARTGRLTPHDQLALNQAIYQDGLETEVLSANANWICDRGTPMWNDDNHAFCEPYPPFRTISTVHLAGRAKRTSYRIRRTGGGEFDTMIRFGVRPTG